MKMSRDEIRRRKLAHASHLNWMLQQRACMERIVQMSIAGNQEVLVENGDKCGDECLFLPADYRTNADNVGKYRFRVALQANVYAGKLFHLSLLLPHLVTGSNFGIQSMLNGLVAMVKLGEVGPVCRKFLRGVDGGSENNNLASLAMNSMLVHVRRFDIVQQTRLPPSHSHHWLTDGLFSTIEGWMTGKGFHGCATLQELVEYLQMRFSQAKSYSSKRVEINFLIVNFAFTKWFKGHIKEKEVTRIGDPLVWRHTWVAETKTVCVQYKYALSDEGSFEKDEWGPWVKKQIQVEGAELGEVRTMTVLRSDPAGVDLMLSYPSISDDPGPEAWKDEETWKAKKVHADLQSWIFHQHGEAHHRSWAELHRWYRAHPEAQCIPIGDVNCLGPGLVANAHSIPSSTWREMWKVLSLDEDAAVRGSSSASTVASGGPVVAFHPPTSKRVNREALSMSTSLAELNRVRHSGNTARDVAVSVAQDEAAWKCHIAAKLAVKGMIWLIRLRHSEGEFKLGLGRRTFAPSDTQSVVEIEWFERKNKRQQSWGMQPGFKLAIASYDRRRRPVFQRSPEKVSNFCPVIVSLTPKSTPHEPTLLQSCMDAIRMLPIGTEESDSSGSEEEEEEEEGEEACSDESAIEMVPLGKRGRKAA